MIKRSVGIHDGVFHADEVTACALLALFDLIDSHKIVRTRDPAKLQACEYICDVGGRYDPVKKRFDHHQVEYTGPLSSAGMVLKYLIDKQIIESELYQFLNDHIIKGVDQEDTGEEVVPKGVCSFSEVISYFLPTEYNHTIEEEKEAFHNAFNFTIGHLTRMIARYRYNMASKQIVQKEMQKNEKLMVFDKAMPWLDSFFAMGGEGHPAEFIIMPSQSHWKLRGIPPNLDQKMRVRHPLPESWAGLHEDELKEKSGIDGAIFCHKGRFISIWETKEDALKAYKLVMGES